MSDRDYKSSVRHYLGAQTKDARIASLDAALAEREKQCESLQNKWASRPLLQSDCDALEAKMAIAESALQEIADGYYEGNDWPAVIARAALSLMQGEHRGVDHASQSSGLGESK